MQFNLIWQQFFCEIFQKFFSPPFITISENFIFYVNYSAIRERRKGKYVMVNSNHCLEIKAEQNITNNNEKLEENSLSSVPLIKKELYAPMLYYGSRIPIAIDYISDIHLLHHQQYYNDDIHKTIRALSKCLYESKSCDIQFFLGDVSSQKDITFEFFKRYRMNAIYHQYKKFKRTLVSKDDVLIFEREKEIAKYRINILSQYLSKKNIEFKRLMSKINGRMKYKKIVTMRDKFENIEAFLSSDCYKRCNLPDYMTKNILAAADLEKEILTLEQSKQKLDRWINTAKFSNKTLKLQDFKYNSTSLIGVVILGNHEYIGFDDVEEAFEFYKKKLEPLGYIVLQNTFVMNDEIVIYGGSGFAKYNKQYNANNLVCCKAMMGNREYEIEQTTLFEKGYENARKYAAETGKCFICAAHYPIDSCLNKFDKDAVYFTGHTHRNERFQTENKVLYADNQVGYHRDGKFDGIIHFERAEIGTVRNPYFDLKDGCYQTSPEMYLQFYDYIGEYIGKGKLIRKRCENGILYVIKSKGFYGFFLINNAGISIVNGGMTKKIALSKNINWIHNNFNCVVNKYLAALEPLRTMQNEISLTLKKLGFSGNIHGLIVDINFDNHIMVNPVNGQLIFYYSPEFGDIMRFESFQKQLEFMDCTDRLKDMSTEFSLKELLETVSRRTGAYGLSRVISPLQRLFTGHVLRDFDLKLIEIDDENPINRKVSLLGRVYMDKDFSAYLVIDDELGEFIRLLNEQGVESVTTILKLKSSMRLWTINIEETINNYGTELPDAWYNSIQQIALLK